MRLRVFSSCRCWWKAMPTLWDVWICWGEEVNAQVYCPLDLRSPRMMGSKLRGGDGLCFNNWYLVVCECTTHNEIAVCEHTTEEIYLKHTYSYVSYLSYLINLRDQCSCQAQCTTKSRSCYLEGPNIEGPSICSMTVLYDFGMYHIVCIFLLWASYIFCLDWWLSFGRVTS